MEQDDRYAKRNQRPGYAEELGLDVGTLDLADVQETLEEFKQEFQEDYVDDGENWHAPEYWWSQRVDKLATVIGHRLHRDNVERLVDRERERAELERLEGRVDDLREEYEVYRDKAELRSLGALLVGLSIGLAVGVFLL